MATTGHEDEKISVGGLKASLQKFKNDKVDPIVSNHATTGATGDYPYNGKGLVTLPKNMVSGVNTLTQAMMPTATGGNTVYVIKYDYDLAGQTVTVPENCVLKFEGGTLSNGTFNNQGTVTVDGYGCLVGFNTTNNVSFTKPYHVSTVHGYTLENGADGSEAKPFFYLQDALDICNNIVVERDSVFWADQYAYRKNKSTVDHAISMLKHDTSIGVYGKGANPVMTGYAIIQGFSYTNIEEGEYLMDFENASLVFPGHLYSYQAGVHPNIKAKDHPILMNLGIHVDSYTLKGKSNNISAVATREEAVSLHNSKNMTYSYVPTENENGVPANTDFLKRKTIGNCQYHNRGSLFLYGIDCNGKSLSVSDFVFEYLSFGLIAATNRTSAKNCTYRYIGGNIQPNYTSSWVRFGNAIEGYGSGVNSAMTVEHCSFDTIFDAAITIQGFTHGNEPHSMNYFHDNNISNSRYGLEFFVSSESNNYNGDFVAYVFNNTFKNCINTENYIWEQPDEYFGVIRQGNKGLPGLVIKDNVVINSTFLFTQAPASAGTNVCRLINNVITVPNGTLVMYDMNGKKYADIDNPGAIPAYIHSNAWNSGNLVNIFRTSKDEDKYANKVFLAENGGVLTQAMVNTANTIYVIQYDYTLSSDITMPAGCVLEFAGGTIGGSGKTLTGKNTAIVAAKEQIFNSNLTLAGTWNVKEGCVEWFGCYANNSTKDTTPAIKKLVAVGMPIRFGDGTWYLSECLLSGLEKKVNIKGTSSHYRVGTTFKAFNASGQRFIMKLGGYADFSSPADDTNFTPGTNDDTAHTNAYKSVWCSNFTLDGINFDTNNTTFVNADGTGECQNYAAVCFEWCVEGYVDIRTQGSCPGVFIASTWEVYFECITCYGCYTGLNGSAVYFGKCYTDVVYSNVSAVTINNLFAESIKGKLVDCHNHANIADLVINNVEFEPYHSGQQTVSHDGLSAYQIIESNIRSMDVLYYFNFSGHHVIINSIAYCGNDDVTYENDTIARGFIKATTYGLHLLVGKIYCVTDNPTSIILGAANYAKLEVGEIESETYLGSKQVFTISEEPASSFADIYDITNGKAPKACGDIIIRESNIVVDKDYVKLYGPGLLFNSENISEVCRLRMYAYNTYKTAGLFDGIRVPLVYFFNTELTRKFRFNGTKLVFKYIGTNRFINGLSTPDDKYHIKVTYYKDGSVAQTDRILLTYSATEIQNEEYSIWTGSYDYCTIYFNSGMCIESVTVKE